MNSTFLSFLAVFFSLSFFFLLFIKIKNIFLLLLFLFYFFFFHYYSSYCLFFLISFHILFFFPYSSFLIIFMFSFSFLFLSSCSFCFVLFCFINTCTTACMPWSGLSLTVTELEGQFHPCTGQPKSRSSYNRRVHITLTGHIPIAPQGDCTIISHRVPTTQRETTKTGSHGTSL